ncbi:MAG: response regulator [Nitrospina sp.]|jgi:CheY-like chemotaxis protein|nr:response regulator [Nitrospina sp.]MBT6514262.1 response regulator [Crocinitomicaceae bacterium]
MKNFSDLNVLLLDDDENMRKYILQILKEYLFKRTFEVGDGEDGFKVLRDNKINLILCDWVMPNMDGLEFYNAIKSSPGFS